MNKTEFSGEELERLLETARDGERKRIGVALKAIASTLQQGQHTPQIRAMRILAIDNFEEWTKYDVVTAIFGDLKADCDE